MNLRRLILVVGVLVLTACSSPTDPGLPQPEEKEKPDPEQPGLVVVLADSSPRFWLA